MQGQGKSFVVLWCVIAAVKVAQGRSANACGGKPADVIFVVDSSASIWGPDFAKQLEFINGVVDMFDVAPEKTRIGAVSFSNWAVPEFNLDAHASKESVQAAVRKILHQHGGTNTAAALAYIRDTMFTEAGGARQGVPHIAVVLTDGESNEPQQTVIEALRAQTSGIHIFAIGVGSKIVMRELKAISSNPHHRYTFAVEDFSALDSIKRLLAIKTCKVTDPPTTVAPTTPANIMDQSCGNAAMADIAFATSAAGTPEDTEKALEFYRQVASGFDIADDRVRVALVPRHCSSLPEISLTDFEQEKDATLNAIDSFLKSRQTAKDVLRYMRTVSFKTKNGGRSRAKKMGVILVDEGDQDLRKTIREAKRMKSQHGIELFVVGVGKQLNRQQLEEIASAPAQQHVYHVSNYDELPQITSRLRAAICPVPRL